MRRLTAVLLTVLTLCGATLLAQATQDDEQQRSLRTRIEETFDVVPLTDGLALRPKSRIRDVRLIEIAADGEISINGSPVTGSELRERLGTNAEPVMRVSYLDPDARRALFAARETTAPEPVEKAPADVEAAPPPARDETPRRARRGYGDRVRIFGDVDVAEDESVSGQVVAVIGSVRIDGEVGDQVVAVLGSVNLGPKAVVRGDVVSVGGRVNRAPGAQIRGGVTEVALADIDIPIHVRRPIEWWGPMYMFGGFGAVPRLIGSTFRLLLLVLFAGLALIIARPTVEAAALRLSENPVQATFVGIATQVLLVPTLILAAIVLAISIIGIPLLLLLPFVVLILLMLALVGFAGAATAVGQWLRGRTGMPSAGGLVDVALGVLVILLPLLVGRVIGLAGWPINPVAFLLVALGLAVEFLAWTSGFGAVLTNAFSRWQARRASRLSPPPPVTP
jgi:hypothetical protein